MIRYCPVCGVELTEVIPLEEWKNGTLSIIYDCYCSSCGFSGLISPDDLFAIEDDKQIEVFKEYRK